MVLRGRDVLEHPREVAAAVEERLDRRGRRRSERHREVVTAESGPTEQLAGDLGSVARGDRIVAGRECDPSLCPTSEHAPGRRGRGSDCPDGQHPPASHGPSTFPDGRSIRERLDGAASPGWGDVRTRAEGVTSAIRDGPCQSGRGSASQWPQICITFSVCWYLVGAGTPTGPTSRDPAPHSHDRRLRPGHSRDRPRPRAELAESRMG